MTDTYRFEFRVTDAETGDVVITDWATFFAYNIGQFGECESVDIHVASALRKVNRFIATKELERERAKWLEEVNNA